jgi:hypothetical protein
VAEAADDIKAIIDRNVATHRQAAAAGSDCRKRRVLRHRAGEKRGLRNSTPPTGAPFKKQLAGRLRRPGKREAWSSKCWKLTRGLYGQNSDVEAVPSVQQRRRVEPDEPEPVLYLLNLLNPLNPRFRPESWRFRDGVDSWWLELFARRCRFRRPYGFPTMTDDGQSNNERDDQRSAACSSPRRLETRCRDERQHAPEIPMTPIDRTQRRRPQPACPHRRLGPSAGKRPRTSFV